MTSESHKTRIPPRDAALSFYQDQIAGCQVGLCHPHQQGLFQTKIGDTLLRSLFIFSLTYSTPHVYALPRPSPLPLINFTNSSYLSSFHYTITSSSIPAIKSPIPSLVSINNSKTLASLCNLQFLFSSSLQFIHGPLFLLSHIH